jgi:hypothetical protein
MKRRNIQQCLSDCRSTVWAPDFRALSNQYCFIARHVDGFLSNWGTSGNSSQKRLCIFSIKCLCKAKRADRITVVQLCSWPLLIIGDSRPCPCCLAYFVPTFICPLPVHFVRWHCSFRVCLHWRYYISQVIWTVKRAFWCLRTHSEQANLQEFQHK